MDFLNKKSMQLKKWGGIVLVSGIILALFSNFLFRFNPVTVTKKYVSALKNGDISTLKSLGTETSVDKVVFTLGENYLKKVKLSESIYYKTGFEKWVFLFEKVWRRGNELNDPETKFDQIAKSGYESLAEDEKNTAGDFKLFILNDNELPEATMSRNSLAAEMINYVIKNNIEFKIALKDFSGDKLEFIKKMADQNTEPEYKAMMSSVKLENMNESDFIKVEGERILKEKLITKYEKFETGPMECVYSMNEFQAKPFKGDMAHVLVSNKYNMEEFTFLLKKSGFIWKIVGIPGNSL
jgi:hypothetical protein